MFYVFFLRPLFNHYYSAAICFQPRAPNAACQGSMETTSTANAACKTVADEPGLHCFPIDEYAFLIRLPVAFN